MLNLKNWSILKSPPPLIRGVAIEKLLLRSRVSNFESILLIFGTLVPPHLLAAPTPSKDQAPMTMPLKRTCSLWHESHRKKVLSANFLPNLCLPFDHEGREKQATKKGQTTFLANSFFATTTNKYKSIKILKEYPMLE